MFKLLKILFFRCYLPILAVFSIVSFFDSNYRLDLPLSAMPLQRMVASVLENATFTSDRLSASWQQFKYSDTSYTRMKNNTQLIISLISYVMYGFVVMNMLQIPIFFYIWVKREPYTWGIRNYSLFLDRPAFRHISFLIKIGVCLLLIPVALKNMSLVETILFTIGSFWAVRRPIVMLVILNITDLYKLKPPKQVINFFNKSAVNDQIKTTTARHVNVNKSASTANSNSTNHSSKNSANKAKNKDPNKSKSPSKPEDWWDKINR